jgi:hypothetical protein
MMLSVGTANGRDGSACRDKRQSAEYQCHTQRA